MIGKVRRYASFGLDAVKQARLVLRGQIDRVRFTAAEKSSVRLYSRVNVFHLAAELRKPYCRYMLQCTKDDMPITFALACFLLEYLRASTPRRILDLGSGFSSFVFRYYASCLPEPERPAIYSVDDSEYWLEQTRLFLAAEHIADSPADRLLTWEQLCTEPVEPFDFVLVDLGSIGFRRQIVGRTLREFAAPGARVILDDMHFDDYRQAALREARAVRGARISLQAVCQDEYLKIAYLIKKPR